MLHSLNEIVLTKLNNLTKVLLCIINMHNNNSTHLSHDWIESFFAILFFFGGELNHFFLFAFFGITSFLRTKWFVTSSCRIIEQSRIRKRKNWKLKIELLSFLLFNVLLGCILVVWCLMWSWIILTLRY